MLSIVSSCGIFVRTPAYIEEKTTFRKCLMSKQFFRIYLPSVFMHTSADIASEVSDELLYGTTVRKISPPIPAKNGSGNYYRCETDYGYSGYLHEKYLGFPDNSDTDGLIPYIITASCCDILIDCVYKYRPVLTLSRASIVRAKRVCTGSERFFPIFHKGCRCFVPSFAVKRYALRTQLDEGEKEQIRKSICDDALSYLGTPYRWGGRSFSGIDCSGLCFTAYFLSGIQIWRDSFADKRYVHEIDMDDLLPGDLIYFKGHMAIYIGDGEYVHSSASAGCVTVNSFNKSSIIYRQDLAQSIVCFARSNLM